MRVFFNVEDRVVDSNGADITHLKYEVGDEMIADYENGIVTAPTTYGRFVFNDPKESEISPYASLAELCGVGSKDGRFSVGISQP